MTAYQYQTAHILIAQNSSSGTLKTRWLSESLWISRKWQEFCCNIYIRWPLPTPRETNRRRNRHFAAFDKGGAHLSSLKSYVKILGRGWNFQALGLSAPAQPWVHSPLCRRAIGLERPEEDLGQETTGERMGQRKEPPVDMSGQTSPVINSVTPSSCKVIHSTGESGIVSLPENPKETLLLLTPLPHTSTRSVSEIRTSEEVTIRVTKNLSWSATVATSSSL